MCCHSIWDINIIYLIISSNGFTSPRLFSSRQQLSLASVVLGHSLKTTTTTASLELLSPETSWFLAAIVVPRDPSARFDFGFLWTGMRELVVGEVVGGEEDKKKKRGQTNLRRHSCARTAAATQDSGGHVSQADRREQIPRSGSGESHFTTESANSISSSEIFQAPSRSYEIAKYFI